MLRGSPPRSGVTQKMNWAKILIATLICLVSADIAYAGVTCSLGHAAGRRYTPALDRPPTHRAAAELDQIYKMLCPRGCGRYRLVQNPTVPNAFAQVIGRQVTKIAYNPTFMNQIAIKYGPGATFGILAHEFGHHIDLNTTAPWMNTAWSRELKADAWAGCALARAGILPNQIQNSLRAIAAYPSHSHPGWQQRHVAVRQGFESCGGRWAKQFNIGQRRPKIPSARPRPTVAWARFCETRRGRCQLMRPLQAGTRCLCPVYNSFGVPISHEAGTARP